MIITTNDLPVSNDEWIVVATASEPYLTVNMVGNQFSIDSGDGDVVGSAAQIVAKLNDMGATIIGWECA